MLYSPLLSSPLVATRNRKRGSRVGLARWPITNPCQHPASRHYPPSPSKPAPERGVNCVYVQHAISCHSLLPSLDLHTYTHTHIYRYTSVAAWTYTREGGRAMEEREREREREMYIHVEWDNRRGTDGNAQWG